MRSPGHAPREAAKDRTGLHPDFTPQARRIGMWAALTGGVLGVVYLPTTLLGLLARSSPQAPIPDPYVSLMEVLILVSAPTMVVITAIVYAWAAPTAKTSSLLALIFMSLMAGVTCCVHFVILTVSHQPAVAHAPWRWWAAQHWAWRGGRAPSVGLAPLRRKQ